MTEQNFNVQTTATQQLVATSVSDEFKDLVEKQGFKVPDNYHVANALQEAVAMLPNVKGIENVTPDSIKKSLFDMVVQGLSPAKTQVYFIAYGRQLQMQRSYFGTQQVLKRLPEIENIAAFIVHEGEDFQVDYNEDGELIVTEHHTDFMKLDNPIVGAYAVITKTDGTKQYEVMTKKQIDASWGQSRQLNVHKKFPEEMAKRTVINRAAKNIINTTDDESALVSAINGTTANEFADDPRDVTAEVVEKPKGAFARMAKKEAVKPIEQHHEQEQVDEPETRTAEPEEAVVEPERETEVVIPQGRLSAANTVSEIKAWLSFNGVSYLATDTKPVLLAKVRDYELEQERGNSVDEELDMPDEEPDWAGDRQSDAPVEPEQTGFSPEAMYGGGVR